MILEHAIFAIKPGQSKDFEAAFAKARIHRRRHRAFETRDAAVHRSPDSYLLLVWWDSVEDHMKGFRESDAFMQWRVLAGAPCISPAPPEVASHYAPRR